MAKQTSVEWLHKKWLKGVRDGSIQILGSRIIFPKDWLDKAKAMHQDETIDACLHTAMEHSHVGLSVTTKESEKQLAKEYYKKTYVKRKKVSVKASQVDKAQLISVTQIKNEKDGSVKSSISKIRIGRKDGKSRPS